MALEVVWTDEAKEWLDEVVEYLEEHWREKEIRTFFCTIRRVFRKDQRGSRPSEGLIKKARS